MNSFDSLQHPLGVDPYLHAQVEEPTVRMTFMVNTSAFAGREGKFVTSRNIKVCCLPQPACMRVAVATVAGPRKGLLLEASMGCMMAAHVSLGWCREGVAPAN